MQDVWCQVWITFFRYLFLTSMWGRQFLEMALVLLSSTDFFKEWKLLSKAANSISKLQRGVQSSPCQGNSRPSYFSNLDSSTTLFYLNTPCFEIWEQTKNGVLPWLRVNICHHRETPIMSVKHTISFGVNKQLCQPLQCLQITEKERKKETATGKAKERRRLLLLHRLVLSFFTHGGVERKLCMAAAGETTKQALLCERWIRSGSSEFICVAEL